MTGFGEKGISAEKVASDACDEAQAYLAAGVPVGIHLADQLLIPMALAGGGTFRHPEADETHGHECRRDSTVPRCVDRPRARGQRHLSREHRIADKEQAS